MQSSFFHIIKILILYNDTLMEYPEILEAKFYDNYSWWAVNTTYFLLKKFGKV